MGNQISVGRFGMGVGGRRVRGRENPSAAEDEGDLANFTERFVKKLTLVIGLLEELRDELEDFGGTEE